MNPQYYVQRDARHPSGEKGGGGHHPAPDASPSSSRAPCQRAPKVFASRGVREGGARGERVVAPARVRRSRTGERHGRRTRGESIHYPSVIYNHTTRKHRRIQSAKPNPNGSDSSSESWHASLFCSTSSCAPRGLGPVRGGPVLFCVASRGPGPVGSRAGGPSIP